MNTAVSPVTIQSEAKANMDKAIEALSAHFHRIRTGRPSPGLLEMIRVNQTEGGSAPLQHIASISVSDARTLMVNPWDKSQIPAIEKAILSAELGLNPVTVGNAIRVPMPALSEARRKDYVKQVKKDTEEARNEVRRYRRDANTDLKGLLKNKEISEDQEKRAQVAIQNLTDQAIAQIDKMASAKEEQIMIV